ncbi:hypothetical protein [Streptomyces sp. 4N124]
MEIARAAAQDASNALIDTPPTAYGCRGRSSDRSFSALRSEADMDAS